MNEQRVVQRHCSCNKVISKFGNRILITAYSFLAVAQKQRRWAVTLGVSKMKNVWRLLFVIIISMLQNGCENSTAPETLGIILISNFEQDGKPSLGSWKDGYPIYGYKASSFSFSNDTPIEGGKWSLKLQSPSSSYSVMRLSLTPNQPSVNNTFRLSFWCKNTKSSNCSVELAVYSGNQSFGWSANIDSSDWKQYYINSIPKSLSVDSLGIFIAMYASSDSSRFALFDRFKLEQK